MIAATDSYRIGGPIMAVLALSTTGFEGVATERLEADICELFGQISAATAR
jgi:hypothetical protein